MTFTTNAIQWSLLKHCAFQNPAFSWFYKVKLLFCIFLSNKIKIWGPYSKFSDHLVYDDSRAFGTQTLISRRMPSRGKTKSRYIAPTKSDRNFCDAILNYRFLLNVAKFHYGSKYIPTYAGDIIPTIFSGAFLFLAWSSVTDQGLFSSSNQGVIC